MTTRERLPPIGPSRHRWTEAISVGDALSRAADAAPDRRALVMPEAAWSYADLRDGANRVARGLIGLGVVAGERVAVLNLNGPETVAALFGIALAGAVIVPINARYRAAEVAHVLLDSGAVAVITSDATDDYVCFAGLLGEAVIGLDGATTPATLSSPSHPALRTVVLLGATRRAGMLDEPAFAAAAARVGDEALNRRRSEVALRRPAFLLYTSGTTAEPRAAVLSHESVVRVWAAVADRLRLSEHDLVWNPCPMYHIAAIGMTLACVLTGATMLTARYFEPGQSATLLARERPTALFPAYATIMLAILNHPQARSADLAAATRTLVVGGPDTLSDIQRRMPATTVVSTFGMTESAGCSTLHELGDDEWTRTRTVGAPLPGLEARIADAETGAVLPAGRAGEIQLRGALLCDGYHRDPAKTEATFLAGGWMRTGDGGLIDAAGRLAYRGRIKDMLKIGGENVSPVEIEAHLMTHPSVQAAQVVGIPDERLEEVPVAFVEARPGAIVRRQDLLAHCEQRIARFKVPRAFYLVSEWPMSATKIQKFKLREYLLADPSAGADAAGDPSPRDAPSPFTAIS